MLRRLGFVASVGVITVGMLLGTPASGSAEGLPLSKTVQAGRPLHALKVSVEVAGPAREPSSVGSEPAVVIVGGKRHEIPLRGARGASVESIILAPDAAVTLVRLEGANGNWAMLLGGRAGNSVLASGKTEWSGDPGERRMFSIEASEPAADQGPRVVRFGTRYESLSQCSNRAPLLGAKRVDASTLEAVADVAIFPAAKSQDVDIEVVNGPQGPQPVFAGLEPAGSSRVDDSTAFYLLPRTVLDGNSGTRWPLTRGDFVTLRWSQRGVGIRELELDLALEGASVPTSLLLLADGDQAIRIPLPSSVPSAGSANVRLRVKPKTALSTTCLSVLSDDLPAGASLALEEVRAYTELDQPGSVERLVSLLVQDGEPGAMATDLLAAMESTGALAVAARFDELSPRGKRRGLRVLAKGLEQPPVLARVLNTARDRDSGLSEQALSVLQAGGEPGRTGLRELALEPSEQGDAAAKVLVQRTGETGALLQALSAPGGSERAGLRAALTLSARRDPNGFASAVEAWLTQTPTPAARASLALAAATAGARTLALRLAEPAWAAPLEFPERYRFAHALAAADASTDADNWLEQQGSGASEWMMRRTAFESLRARDPARAAKLAETLASDAYPRVRAATLEALAEGAGWQRASELGKTDGWPLVRVASARALSRRPEARTQLDAMLADPSERVRVAAIDSLTVLKARESWPAIEPHLKSADEYPDVHSAAIAFARELCLTQAQEPLTNEVRRALRPDASEEAARLGVEALHALHDLGGAAAADAKNLATRPEAPPGLAKAYQNFHPPACEKAP